MKPSGGLIRYYPFLDGFRALAIVWVIIHHINYFFDLSPFFSRPAFAVFDRFAKIGVAGVDVFFVTSGFLISGLVFEDLASGVRIKRFYFRRFFKIVPQYVLVAAAGLLFTLLTGAGASGLQIASYVFLFQNYIQPVGNLGHLWSIAVEEHFYLFFPWLVQGVCAFVRGLKERRRVLLAVFLLLIAGTFFLRRHTFIAYPYNPLLLFQMSHLRFDALLAGCALKLLEARLVSWPAPQRSLAGGGFLVLSAAFFYKVYLSYDPCRSTTYVWAYLAAGFLLASALCGFRPLLRAVEGGFLRWIGKCSYAVYLWHFLIMCVVKFYFPRPGPWGLAALFFGVILAGICSTVTIEKYFLDWRRRLVP